MFRPLHAGGDAAARHPYQLHRIGNWLTSEVNFLPLFLNRFGNFANRFVAGDNRFGKIGHQFEPATNRFKPTGNRFKPPVNPFPSKPNRLTQPANRFKTGVNRFVAR